MSASTAPRQPDSALFYDRHWQRTETAASPEIVAKASRVLELVPRGVATIADVGSGDGYLTSRLAERYDVLAIDRSPVALERVAGRTLCASADALPLDDRSFDLVFTSEMLEHLPDDVLRGAAREIARVARSYVLVAVPHRENLRRRFARCPDCGLEFHVDGHLRSLDEASLDALFPGFERVSAEPFGPHEPATYPALEAARQRLARRWWIWQGRTITCPGCGSESAAPARRGRLHRLIDRGIDAATAALNAWGKRAGGPYWLIALYRRRGA
jgi:SAM-dependent methyltransferase